MAALRAEVQYPGSAAWNKIDITSGEIEWTKDASQPASGWIETDWDTPVPQLAGIRMYRSGGICFRGFAKKVSANPLAKTRKITIAADPEMLKWRRCPQMVYELNKHCLVHLCQSDPPSNTADTYGVANNIGLIFAANSFVPPKGMTAESSFIYSMVGGTLSAFYPGAVFWQGVPLVSRPTHTLMAATDNSYFYDLDKLYINIVSTLEGGRAQIFVENWCDTHIRMGHIDHPELELSGNYKIGPKKKILDAILSPLSFHGLNTTWLLEDDATYLTAYVEDGRGEVTGGFFSIQDSDILDREFVDGDEMPLSGLFGLGAGSDECMQVYSKYDTRHKLTRKFFDALDIDDGFADAGGQMWRYVDEEYAARSNTQIKRITVCQDHFARPRDWIGLEWYGGEVVQVHGITMASKGDLVVDTYELGYRSPKIPEVFDSWDEMSDCWNEQYKTELVQISDSGYLTVSDPTHGSCTPFTFTVNFPVALTGANYNHRVTLDLNFSAIEGDTIEPMKAEVIVFVGAATGGYAWMPRSILLNSISDIDITALMTYGSDVSISIYVRKTDDFAISHSSCSSHPQINCSATATLWRRKIIPAYL
jgi:hypothetical protein